VIDISDESPNPFGHVAITSADLLKMLERIRYLEEQNKTLKLYYKDALEQQDVIKELRRVLAPFVKHARTALVMNAARKTEFLDLVPRKGEGNLMPEYFIEASFWYERTRPPKSGT
jgi:hypothetical protein